jgi:hypothetical protein
MNILAIAPRLFGACLGAVAFAALSVSSAAAQGTPITIDGIYQQSTNTQSLDGVVVSPNCANTQSCYFLFSRVKGNKRLIVTQISCTIPHNAANVRFAALMPEAGGTLLFRTQYFVPVPTTDDRVGFSSPTLQVFDSKERPVVEVVFDAPVNIFGSCTIAGQMKDVP